MSAVTHRKGLGMPIAQFVDDSEFDPEKRVMDAAFEMAREALELGDERKLANERIAKSIIELAKAGEHNADLLCESDRGVSAKVAELGGSIPPKSERNPAKFSRFVKAEIERWSPILKAASAETATAGQSGTASQSGPAGPPGPQGQSG